MKKRVLLICVALLLMIIWLMLRKPNSETQSTLTVRNLNQLKIQEKGANERKSSILSNTNSSASPDSELNEPVASKKIDPRFLAEWQAPIEFYGKVVDENSNAIEGAKVGFGWPELPTEDGERSSNALSDAFGFFSLHGVRGPNLSVGVSKDGYYASRQQQTSFTYALGGVRFKADFLNPVIFTLRKKSQGADLMTSGKGFRSNMSLRLKKDGTPVRVDFFQRQVSTSGQLEIRQIKPPLKDATEWSFSMTIPDGGFVENQDEFQFQAPDTNYQPTVEYHFSKSDTNWTIQVSKQFYIALGQPRKYGWLRIDSNLAQETVFLTYAINPSGSQNLEPQSP